MGEKNPEHDNGADPMDNSGGLESPKGVGKGSGPACIGEFQSHPGRGQADEADDHEDVENTVEPTESLKAFPLVFSHFHRLPWRVIPELPEYLRRGPIRLPFSSAVSGYVEPGGARVTCERR